MKKLIVIGLLAIVLVSGCVEDTNGTYDARYINSDLTFLSNLDIAQNISVYPDEDTLRHTIFGYQVASLQFAYYDNDKEAPLYMKSLMSFASKYTKMTYDRWGGYDMNGRITSVMLNSTDDLPNATVEDPAILLLGPGFGKETHIIVVDNIVMVYGKDLTLRDGKYAKYSDFDLALDKIIMVLMEENL
ncbi:MAG: hypothetical protein KJ906_00760 [Nanoarchaeota archaeon]|nr:hypothetical protein [Nanoarchaeota archaeon]